MTYDAKSQLKYRQKCKKITINYTPVDISEYNALEKLISNNNTNFSKYCKNLIRADLQSKGLLNKPDHKSDS